MTRPGAGLASPRPGSALPSHRIGPVPAPYLLLQSRDATDPVRALEVEGFAAALGVPVGALEVVDLLARAPTAAEVRGARAVLLGGSGDYSVLDPFPWVARAVGSLRDEVLPSGTPTFASCFGFQLLVLALGGAMERDPARREVGSVEVTRLAGADRDPLFHPLPPVFVVQAGHTDRASAVPPGAVALAGNAACPVQAFRVVGAPVWATQFHPEIDERSFPARWRAYAAKYPPAAGAGAADAPAFLATLRPSPHASALLKRFALLVAGG